MVSFRPDQRPEVFPTPMRQKSSKKGDDQNKLFTIFRTLVMVLQNKKILAGRT